MVHLPPLRLLVLGVERDARGAAEKELRRGRVSSRRPRRVSARVDEARGERGNDLVTINESIYDDATFLKSIKEHIDFVIKAKKPSTNNTWGETQIFKFSQIFMGTLPYVSRRRSTRAP